MHCFSHDRGLGRIVPDNERNMFFEISLPAIVINGVLNKRVGLEVGGLFGVNDLLNDVFVRDQVAESNARRKYL